MGDLPRKADGRRIFSTEFKRGVVQQLAKGEKTLAELSRELDTQPNVVREWTRRVEAGAKTAVSAKEDVVPASALREAQQRIRELERLVGKKQMEIEILDAPGIRPLDSESSEAWRLTLRTRSHFPRSHS